MKFDSEVAPSQSFEAIIDPMDKLSAEDKLSQVNIFQQTDNSLFICFQINVLQQLVNICSHQILQEHLESGEPSNVSAHINIDFKDVCIFMECGSTSTRETTTCSQRIRRDLWSLT